MVLPMITRSHGKKYCRAQSQVWNGTKCLGSGVGTHIFITIPLRKKKNWNERERVYMWDINIIVQCCFSIVCYSIHFTSLPIPNVLPPSIPPNHTPPAFMSPVQVIVLLLSMFWLPFYPSPSVLPPCPLIATNPTPPTCCFLWFTSHQLSFHFTASRTE